MKLDEVLPYLICNRCECVELTLRKATGTDKPSGSSLIECNACHNKYLIDDGIIVTEPALWRGHDSPRARIFRTTFSSYSNWWLKVNKGIGYKQDLALLFKQQTGRDRAFLGGKSVLDAGCGAGRFISHVSEAPDSKVIAFDLGLGLKVAKERNANRQNIAYVQGNILNPPFREGVFDFVYSFGVLHHTPDPRIAFSRLASLVKVGGEFALYLYYRPHLAFKDWGVSYALKQAYLFLYREPIRRFVQILPHPLVLLFSRVIYYRGPVMEFFYRRNGKIIGDFIRALVPASIWRPLESREHNVIRNYDYYSTRYNYDHSNEEVLLWYQEFGFDNVRIGKLPVTMSGEKIPKAIEPIRVSYYPPDAGLWKDYEAIGIEREPIEYSAVQKAVPRI